MKNLITLQNSGLKETDLTYIRELLKNIPEIERARIFGSRAKGNWKKGSDIDIAIEGNISHQKLSVFKLALRYESPFPFMTDVIEYEKAGKDIRDHIDRVGKEIYVKK